MKPNACGLSDIAILAALVVLIFSYGSTEAQIRSSGAHKPPVTPNAAVIPFDQIGAVAGKQYSGDGLAVSACSDGATLRCVFQRLNAKVTTQGLWLVSTKDGANGEPFRVVARALGRAQTEPLAASGKVEVDGQVARFIRPGLTEEYSVGIDGLRQDFVIEQRPPGNGAVRLVLEVDGAKAEAMLGGARLVLADGGRQMVYNHLKAVDARGKEVAARLEVLSSRRLAVVLDDGTAEYPVRIDPTFSDANWSALGSGMGGSFPVVNALAVSGNTLYAGGDFTTAGGSAATGIARWNGSSWSALGSGMDGLGFGPGFGVFALAVMGTNLYAGGYFTNAGGTTANCIAQWNGSSWSALGSGMDETVYALAVSGNTLYAGGAFTTAGGNAANCIAQWNGSSWSALGSGMEGYALFLPVAVNALAVMGTGLYAGGNFTNAGGTTANYIAQWNGSSWSALGSGMNYYVDALAVSGNTLYAGGAFTTAGGNAANYIAQWNGSSWSALGSGMGGSFAVVNALAVSGNTLYAGGFFTTAGGIPANYIAQWNGSSWSALGSGMSGGVVAYSYSPFVSALAVMGTNLYAGGDFTSAGGTTANYIAEAIIAAPTLTISIANSMPALSWASIPGSTNRLWAATNLSLPQWQVIATNVAGADGLVQFIDLDTAGINAKFYRISAP